MKTTCIRDYSANMVIINDSIIVTWANNLWNFIMLMFQILPSDLHLPLSYNKWFKTVGFFDFNLSRTFVTSLVRSLSLTFLNHHLGCPPLLNYLTLTSPINMSPLLPNFTDPLLIFLSANHLTLQLVAQFFEFARFNDEVVGCHAHEEGEVDVEKEKLGERQAPKERLGEKDVYED